MTDNAPVSAIDIEQSDIKSNITITPSAQDYLTELLAKQETPGIGVRIFVEHPGTPRAECCMAYNQPGEEDEADLQLPFEAFTAYIEASSVPYLEDAVIDYNKDRFGGQLTFRAPNSKVPKVGADASVEERINYVLQSEINPSLAAHGGDVQLLELIEEEGVGLTAVLKFGGGCQGCSAVDMTLRQGVEVQLKQQIPELTQVVDDTDHTRTENAYYK
ncbi:Fe-S biogenesis protein NfuA [Psychrobacter sanguinis]|uniref:Fe-S biogenesis protein NfuA n=1 Tax=Psychrobacter sanguinis TaxID=861445 RepID=UPI00020C7B2C|nr:Fe-S biogenesis protein NfuA [Psychrobacter sanguinis]EGK09554.1 Fe/S-biogenesis protein NfuA [Psychrobacter sp. 1501(2011)]MCC3307089.1 Fe-S biogenesis protein NfuA [Psychrobacter sanguinis]MCC3345132.1 Fe-S biogenesis protein NfuA [Psychrobacter sanguinis]MCD9152378.1 Fe-S biogenesis protein NfuA [Psychrobacter sanguinis]MDY3306791.1 Fe-S biogenesis protein NfuA [Psychrobacter sanguinis]